MMTRGVTKFLQASRSLIPSSLKRLYQQPQKELELQPVPANWPPAPQKLHLGCGGNVLEGWANVDLNGSARVIQHDLTQPLPLPSETVQFVYSEHFIEHITRDQALALLRECHRVLVPNGVIRLSTPNLKKLIEEYLAGRTSEWADVHWHPSTLCQMVNEGMRLWGHQFLYDLDELILLMNEAGFQHVTPVTWQESQYPELKELECRPFHGEIIIEAVK